MIVLQLEQLTLRRLSVAFNWHTIICLVFKMRPELLDKLEDCKDELLKIKHRIDQNQFDDMVIFLQRYAIIKACGTVESVVKNLIADHVDAGTSPEIQNYINNNVRESSTNPKTGNIGSLLGEFSSTGWKVSFEDKLKSHGTEKSSLNSLVQLRNDFAHGRSPNTTINTVIQYFHDARTIISLVDDTLNGV